MNTYWWVGIIVALAVLGVFLWWHSRRSRSMADKPKPK